MRRASRTESVWKDDGYADPVAVLMLGIVLGGLSGFAFGVLLF